MAKKATTTKKAPVKKTAGRAAASVGIAESPIAPAIVASTPVRHTPVPKAAAASVIARSETKPIARELSHDMIAGRAREIFHSGTGGSDLENWLRAERELRSI